MAELQTMVDPLSWIRANSLRAGGIPVSQNRRVLYPEVTGYLIPNLLRIGEHALALEYGNALLAVQRKDGAFAGPDGGPGYAFDTGQALRGLVSLAAFRPDDARFAAAAQNAARWLVTTSDAEGLLAVPNDQADWDMGRRGRIPETVHLYALAPLVQVGHLFGERSHLVFAAKARDRYLARARRSGVGLRFCLPNMLSHFFGYVHEALIELGAAEVAADAFKELTDLQQENGAVPAYADVRWVCLPGQLQAAIVFARLGQTTRAMAALEYAESVRRADGGFPGSVGDGANYFADDVPSWAHKFHLDALERLRPVDLQPSESPSEPAVVLDRNLRPDEWHDRITGGAEATEIAARVTGGVVPPWLEPLLAGTRAGDHVLELGSGSGELSAHLARAGRRCHLLDFSSRSLELSAEVFAALSLSGETIQADVTEELPLEDGAVDTVFSSGLLEHFDEPAIVHILRESARVARRNVIALVPNAKSLPYRIGKAHQEREGTWPWGREEPRATLKDLFLQAGMHNVQEWTVAPEHALEFLAGSGFAPVRASITAFYQGLAPAELQALDQGYLLVTAAQVARELPAKDGNRVPAVKSNGRLAVIPNDPLDAYVAAGYPDLTDYFHPGGGFQEVYCLSPHEPREKRMYGMHVIPTTAEELPARIVALGIDVVRAYCLPSGQFACGHKVPGVSYVVSVHDPNPERCPGPLPAADLFLAVSGRIETFLREKGADPARIRRLPNRVDLEVFRPIRDQEARAAFRARFGGRFQILHVGRRSKEKNIETLVRALALLGDEYTGIFVGRGDASSHQELAARVGARCYFLDAVPNADLPSFYAFTDVMCTPSLWEGFGVVFIEALACGSLVVTSDQAPMNEFITDSQTGLLVRDFTKPEALASVLRRATGDQELAASIKARARSAALPFAKQAVDQQEAAIYSGLVGRSGAQAPRPAGRPTPALSNKVRLHLRAPELREEWDHVVRSSPDAFVFHLDHWQQCQMEAYPLQDLSFLVELDGRIVAVCPLQRHLAARHRILGTFMGTGGPAVRGGLCPEERGEILRIAHRAIARFVQDGLAEEVSILLPQLSQTSRAHWACFANPLVAHGYSDTSSVTSIVDLSGNEAALFAAIRAGHRHPISKAMDAGFRIDLLQGQSGMDAYYQLHVETYTRTGVPPHPKSYFDAIARHMVQTGHARTYAVFDGDRLLAAANIARFGDSSLYWTGAYAEQALRNGAGKLLQWEVIRQAKLDGLRWHETGEVFPDAVPQSKEAGLSTYKRGFGGILRPWFKGVLRALPGGGR